MGQKVHPYGFRLGYNRTWHSRWFATKKKDFGKQLLEDLKLKRLLKARFSAVTQGSGNSPNPSVSQIEIDRAANRLRIVIYTSRPGVIIGRKGAELDKLRQELSRRTGKEVIIDVRDVLKPELNAQLQAEKIALQLEKRVAFRRAMRKVVDETLRYGSQGGSPAALGIKVRVSGRLNGAEIARSEWTLQGRLPLHTLRADIDYGFAEAHTTFGVIGIKVWIYRGDIMNPREAMMKR
ncbi:MAG: 30S ribosomal protein S3 [Acidobacteria bacterium]|jgi:small subunit ribosomal protein S3|nr:30S ribosomal protein S3 [Acidobacteriota bacterium]